MVESIVEEDSISLDENHSSNNPLMKVLGGDFRFSEYWLTKPKINHKLKKMFGVDNVTRGRLA
jgi:hypothetical protein